MQKRKYIGVQINDDIEQLNNAVKMAHNYKINIVQIFINSIKYGKYYNEFKNFIKNNNMKCVVHSSYSINLARKWDEYSGWIHRFINEIEIASKIGAFAIVVHIGKNIGLSQPEAYNNMYSSLLYIHNQTIKYKNLRILLETSSGQGNEMCYKLEDFAYFYKKISKNKNKKISERFGICIDTCHIFAAGYDLKTELSILMYLEAFEELIGLRHVKLVHLNDSKKDVGSNIDRHENLGRGKIGIKSLIFIIKYFLNLNIPIILETPKVKLLDDFNLIMKHVV